MSHRLSIGDFQLSISLAIVNWRLTVAKHESAIGNPQCNRQSAIANRQFHRTGLLLIAGCILALAPAAHASLTVSPTRVVLQVKTGKTHTGFFTLHNGGEAPLEIAVEAEDWAGGISGDRAPVSWLTVKPKAVTLAPGKGARVKYTVRAPKETVGELRTQVFFTTMTGSAGTMRTRSRLGTIIYVTIEGTEQIGAEVSRVSAVYTASTPGISKPDRLDLAIGVHNQSNVHIIPNGQVVLRDAKGGKAATVSFPQGWGLLPNEEDLYHAIGSGIHLAPGRYTMEITISCGADVRKPTSITKTLHAVVSPSGGIELESVP